MTEFYAQPYSLDHTGFYLDSIEKYEAGMKLRIPVKAATYSV